MRVLVCGGRNFSDFGLLCATLDEVKPTFIIHGNASGADELAGQWAFMRNVRGIACPANWTRDGKRAGPMRNQRMLGHRPELVVAFSGGRGTSDMVARARKAGVPVLEVGA